MRLERIAIALRPRSGYEAIDLGARMLQAWWRPIYAAWFAVYAPVALALHGALWEHPFAAFAVLYWLKPLFDRFVLHVVSRAVFGDAPTLGQTLGAWREILGPGLVASLTWRRWLDYARSFTLPVFQLERQRGVEGRARRRLMGQRLRGYALALTATCFAFLCVLFVANAFLADQLLSIHGPAEQDAVTPAELFLGGTWWDLGDNLAYVLAESIVEPFFVCAGFALYLSRRVMLEAWDVELGLRRMSERLERRRNGARAMAAAMLIALVVGGAGPVDAWGQSTPAHQHAAAAEDPAAAARDETPSSPGAPRATPARAAIVAVLDDPLFGSWRDVEHWRARTDPQRPAVRAGTTTLERLGKLLAALTQSVGWIVLAALVIVLIAAIARRYGARGPAPEEAAAPTELFGLAIGPDSLPDDVANAALALLEQGRVREALSIVYRGTLSRLVHGHGLRLARGDTEGDVVAKARGLLARGPSDYLAAVVRAWISVAYAGRAPDSDDVRELCRDYARYFGVAREAPAADAAGAPA